MTWIERPVDSEYASKLDLSIPVPLISVVVPHYNDLKNLRECIDCLRAQTIAAGDFEIIVSDNNSTCGLAAVREACGGLARVVSAAKQGAGEARNAGVVAARSERLAFTDSDCRPARDWLMHGVQALEISDIVGGRMTVSVGDRNCLTSAEAYELVFAFNNRRYVEEQQYSVTANMFTWRGVFNKVGPFRVGVSEDRDWGKRSSILGFRITYCDNAVVTHSARREWSDLLRKWRRLTDESYKLARESTHGRFLWFCRSWLILISALGHIPAVLMSKELDSFDQRAKAIGGLLRLRIWRFMECNRKLLNV